MTPENKALMDRYPQYYRDVSHLEVIDVYRVIDLFNVTDATAQHALKKLLLSGQRTGGKPIEVDLKEARDTLSRGLAMRAEDTNKGQLGFDFAAPGGMSVKVVNHTGQPLDPRYLQDLLKPADQSLVGTFEPQAPAPSPLPQTLRYCGYPGCEMRVRDDNSDRCMIHSKPVTAPYVPPCKEEGCEAPCAPNAIRCAEHCAPPVNRSAGAMPRRTR